MKKVKFNHETDSFLESLGIELEDYASQLATIMAIVGNDIVERPSEISEMMHRTIDYNILLMLATHRLMDLVREFQEDKLGTDPSNLFSDN